MEFNRHVRTGFLGIACLLIPPDYSAINTLQRWGTLNVLLVDKQYYFFSPYLLFLSFKNLFSKISYDIIALTIQNANPNKLFI
jgi:hypothetical protein